MAGDFYYRDEPWPKPQLCGAAIADSWGYGQECKLELGHESVWPPEKRKALHRFERGDGFVILWGYER